MSTLDDLVIATLCQCQEKLEIYRDHSDGAYHGGIEHTALIGNIRRTRGLVRKRNEGLPEKTERPVRF